MTLQIGENIKRLRHAKDITQEQLAAAMNVTCGAVSKWERGESFPDITLLMPLAYYFGISIDELMNYDEEKIVREIEELIEEYQYINRRDRQKAGELITEAYKKYPNDYRIMKWYMWKIVGNLSAKGGDTTGIIAHKEEVISICNKIIDGCKNRDIVDAAYSMLAKIMQAEGKTDEALEFCNKNFPTWYMTKGQQREHLFSPGSPEALYHVKKNMKVLGPFAVKKLVNLILFNTDTDCDEKIQKLENYGDRMATIYEETGEVFFLLLAKTFMFDIAYYVRSLGDKEEEFNRIHDKTLAIKKEWENATKDDAAYHDHNP